MDIQDEPFFLRFIARSRIYLSCRPEAKRLRDNLSFSKSGIESLQVFVRGKEKGESQFVLEDADARLGQIGKVVKYVTTWAGTERAKNKQRKPPSGY